MPLPGAKPAGYYPCARVTISNATTIILLVPSMPEIAGLVVGGVALASLFSTCIEFLNDIRLARSFGADFERCQLTLDLVKLRLSRWGESVRVHGNPSERQHGVRLASRAEADTVKRLLGWMFCRKSLLCFTDLCPIVLIILESVFQLPMTARFPRGSHERTHVQSRKRHPHLLQLYEV
jgi:hypothetical protein